MWYGLVAAGVGLQWGLPSFRCSFLFCSELLASSLSRLGSEVSTLCPQISDREDENELARYFHFVLAKESPNGTLVHVRPLNSDEKLLHMFKTQGSGYCLLLSLKLDDGKASTVTIDSRAGVCASVINKTFCATICMKSPSSELLVLAACTGRFGSPLVCSYHLVMLLDKPWGVAKLCSMSS